MSTTPTARARAAALPAPTRSAIRPWLTVVPARAPRPARTPFVLLVLGVLTGGLLALLVLNTTLAQNTFRLQQLQQRAATLTQQEQALRQQVAADESPQHLAERARALGMVPSENPAFLDTRNGAILGQPVPGGSAATGPARR